MLRVHFTIHGEVQGVGYRFFAQVAADRLGLRGTVRNTGGGRVEVVAEGPAAALDEFSKRLADGPPFSVVDRVDRVDAVPTGEFAAYRIVG